MDNVTIDLGPETEVDAGAEAVLIGAQGEDRIHAEEVAARLDTINYEVTCGDLRPGAAPGGMSAASSEGARPTRSAPSRWSPRRGARWPATPTPGRSAARCATRRSGGAVADLDLAVAGDPGAAAKAVAAELGEHAFELSAEFGTWRVVAARARLAGRRHRPAGAARSRPTWPSATSRSAPSPCRSAAGAALDPHGGLADLERRSLRAVGPRSFERRPAAAAARRPARRRARARDRAGDAGARPRRRRRAPPSRPASASWPSCASWSAAPTRCAAWRCSTSSG